MGAVFPLNNRITVHPSLILWLSILCYLHPVLSMGFLSAAAVHELGHYIALLLMGKPPTGLTLHGMGASMDVPGLGYIQAAFAYAAGPMFSLLLALYGRLFPVTGTLSLCLGLFNLLRRSPDITVGAIRIQPYHEFARNLPVPTNLNLIHLKPLRGTGLVVFSPSLVFIAVDNLFGGDGRFPTKVEGREFTHTEQRVINRMLKLALEGYSDAWKAINPLEVEYVRSEMQVKFTNITTSPNDIVVNTPFHVEIGNLTGEFNICLPFSMIEPLRELLVNPPLENSRNEDQNWRDNLVRQVQHSQLELVANFADISLRLSQILKLKPGDVLPIEKPDRIIAHVDGVPVLTSQYGTLNGQYALRIEHLINPILNSLNEEQPK